MILPRDTHSMPGAAGARLRRLRTPVGPRREMGAGINSTRAMPGSHARIQRPAVRGSSGHDERRQRVDMCRVVARSSGW